MKIGDLYQFHGKEAEHWYFSRMQENPSPVYVKTKDCVVILCLADYRERWPENAIKALHPSGIMYMSMGQVESFFTLQIPA